MNTDDLPPEDAGVEAAAWPAARYMVATPGQTLIIAGVTDLEVSERGHLAFFDAGGGYLAVFAPGEWRSALVAEEEG